MATINGLSALITPDQAADFLAIYDDSAPSGTQDKKISVANLLAVAAKLNDDADFANSVITALTIGTSLTYPSGVVVSDVFKATGSLAFSDIAAGASQTVTLTMTDALTTDYLNWALGGALPDGMTAQAWISAADTVSLKLHNTTASLISGASYTLNATAVRYT